MINGSRSCKYTNSNIKCCCNLPHKNNNNIYIVLENPQNKEMSISISTKNKETLISVAAKNKEITNHIPTQNENEYYCKYCQIGTCVKREKEHIKIIHRTLSNDEKDKFISVWHWRLAIRESYKSVYKKAFDDVAKNKFIEDSKTRFKFSYLKDKNYGLLSLVIDIIIKGKLLILNPFLIYILKDETSNNIYSATWCKYCMGAEENKCPSFKNLNDKFEPTVKYHNLGIQMCLPITMTKNGLKIHSPSYIMLGTIEIKKIATSTFSKDYANDYTGDCSELDEYEIPFAKSFPIEIIDIHQNITKPSVQKIYNDKIKDSS